jgi:hypothetical protein
MTIGGSLSMSTPLSIDGVEAVISRTPGRRHAQVGGGVENIAIAKEFAMKENTVALWRAWKEDRLQKAAKVAVPKNL